MCPSAPSSPAAASSCCSPASPACSAGSAGPERRRNPMAALRIGLTRGIGSGKSTVAGMLADLGAAVIDTDAIARSLAAPGGAAVDALRAQFGAEAIGADGGLDRARMRQIVFADPAAKLQLEAILHPLIGIESDRQAAAAGDLPRVFDVP